LDRDEDWEDLTLKAGLGAEKRMNQFDNTTQLFHAKTSIHLASQVKQDCARWRTRSAAALVADSTAFTGKTECVETTSARSGKQELHRQ
jgi:hypothetical protein